ncbi:MAG: hypothetical protein AAFS10_03410 [Myxococcota bacterium]
MPRRPEHLCWAILLWIALAVLVALTGCGRNAYSDGSTLNGGGTTNQDPDGSTNNASNDGIVGNTSTPGAGVGTGCTSPEQCPEGYRCYSDTGEPPGVCVLECTDDPSVCEGGTFCAFFGNVGICLEGDDPSNGVAPGFNNGTGGLNNMTTGPDDALCEEACSYIEACTLQICDVPVSNLSNCVALCQQQPEGFQGVFGLDCGTINQNLCAQNADVADACACSDLVDPVDRELSCAELLECLQDCDDTSCGQRCLDNTTPEGQSHYNSLVSCAQERCPQQEGNCIQRRCGEEVEACITGRGDGGIIAFCVDRCDLDNPDTCPDGTFCLDVGVEFGLCAAGDINVPALPDNAPACSQQDDCGEEQACVQSG